MIGEFLDDLDRQTELYRQMLATPEAHRLRELLKEVSDLDVRLAPVRRRWPEICRTLDPATATRAGRSIDAARDVLARLVTRFVPPPPRVREAYGG